MKIPSLRSYRAEIFILCKSPWFMFAQATQNELLQTALPFFEVNILGFFVLDWSECSNSNPWDILINLLSFFLYTFLYTLYCWRDDSKIHMTIIIIGGAVYPELKVPMTYIIIIIWYNVITFIWSYLENAFKWFWGKRFMRTAV